MQFSRLTEPVCLSGPIYTLHVLCALSKDLTVFPRNELHRPHMLPHSFENLAVHEFASFLTQKSLWMCEHNLDISIH